MALVPAVPTYGSLIELEDIGSSLESLIRLVESQKELFNSQIDQLQRIVATQCKLTAANPLAQEMAAGALSIKIGKRPRDLLNPKAIKYMQSLFSIKDTIGKKETREISALCRITATQVRDYFASQRTKVRKLARLSQEKATSCDAPKANINGSSSCNQSVSAKKDVPVNMSDNVVPLNVSDKDVPVNMSDLRIVGDCIENPGNSGNITSLYAQSSVNPEDASSTPLQIAGNMSNLTWDCTQVSGNLTDTVTGNSGYVNPGDSADVAVGNLGYVIAGNSGYLVPGNSGYVVPLDLGYVPLNLAYPVPLNLAYPVPRNSGYLVPQNSGNAITLCTQVLRNSENVATVSTQAPGNLGIFSTVCSVPGNSGNLASVSTPPSGYAGTVTPVGTLTPGSSTSATPAQDGQPVIMKPDIKLVGDASSCSLQEETTPGVDSDDKKFVESIFNLMRKEQTFSGRVKLMEWVLQIHNSAVLSWFSTKGGITILASWLSDAALEEQTTVLLVIFKVLCHLPLKTAQPVQMSAILQTVNRLRFYRSSDISNRAKVLLSRWSKMFVRSQALKNSKNFLKNGQKELNKQRTNGAFSEELWSSKLDIPEEILALAQSAEDSRDCESKKSLKLLTDSSDGSARKHDRTFLAIKTKERRKVQLVEQLDSKSGRDAPVAKAVPSKPSRPMSADDIQKAKMRASFMQDKYGKKSNAIENSPQKAEDLKPPPDPKNQKPQPPEMIRNEVKKSPPIATKILPHKPETKHPTPKLSPQDQLLEKLKRVQVPWRRPSEVKLHSSWRVGSGDNSKEAQIQMQRNRREKETLYQNPKEIPPNPKEPWDVEMDFDDSLTLEILIEQPPDPDEKVADDVVNDTPSTSGAAAASVAADADPELLAALLKNPDVVKALTGGGLNGLSQDQLVALLDMVKNGGAGEKLREPEPEPEPEAASLPSPTPPSNASRSGWRSDFMPQPQFSGNRGAPIVPTIAPQTNNQIAGPVAINKYTRSPTTFSSMPQQHQHMMHHQTRTPETMISSPNVYQFNNPPHMHSEPSAFLPKTPHWPQANNAADYSRPGAYSSLNNQANNINYYHNQNNYNNNDNRNMMYPRSNDYAPWPENGRVMGPYDENYMEPRRDFDRSQERASQRQWSSGHHQNQYRDRHR